MQTATVTGWRKSSRSTGNPNNCVEVGSSPGSRGVRDSKNPNGPKLTFSTRGFRSFLDGVRDTND